ncbi:MAG: tetratricopeptide repeat protein, partial [Acidobacteriota bacterium]|nr:tetratricopeptide repeat protein [Acidobacteriota bacterium]
MNRFTLLCLVSVLVLFTSCNTDPKAAGRRYVENGKKYFERGKTKQASIMFRRALQKDPRNAEGWYRLGLVNLTESNLSEARRDFQRSSALLEAPTPKTGTPATPETNKSSASQADAVNPPLTPHDPIWIDALSKLGDIDYFAHTTNTGVPEFARELKNVAAKLLADDPKSYNGLRLEGYCALVLLQESYKVPGEKGIKLAQEGLDTAISKFRTANAAKPYQPEVVSMLVKLLFVAKKDQEAEKLGRELIDKQKTYNQMYDILYLQFLRANRSQ